jgi:plasmid stability protein
MVARMGHIQIRNVPEDVHRTLKVRAVREGKSLSDYLREEIERIAAVPTTEELLERIRARPPVEGFDAAKAIREERDRRDRGLRGRR